MCVCVFFCRSIQFFMLIIIIFILYFFYCYCNDTSFIFVLSCGWYLFERNAASCLQKGDRKNVQLKLFTQNTHTRSLWISSISMENGSFLRTYLLWRWIYEVHVSGQWENVCASLVSECVRFFFAFIGLIWARGRKFSIRFDEGNLSNASERKSWKLFSIISIG